MNKEEKITMFIDTQNMEERYGEELYTDYLEKENKQLKDNWNKLREFINLNYYDGYMYNSTIINKMQELEKGDSNED